jgi:hypothetical protein
MKQQNGMAQVIGPKNVSFVKYMPGMKKGMRAGFSI